MLVVGLEMLLVQWLLKHSNILGGTDLFRDLSLEHISRIIDRMKYQTAGKGDDIVVQGEVPGAYGCY